ncbi:Metallopeptidase, catalytic domain-containing protein [Artemisia annua]|uniref:Metallopeptidase, catalytic domain-containing protein n=1 Tax=Artemisia annua TaxID=35608 RepID=A0A2U1M7W6_ARTAN|nr:Metallopeptidase, catalytic domain-containing protein [Artemisia annua]
MASKLTFLSILFFVVLTLTKGETVNQKNSSAFEFIKNLQGCCHKGSNVQGLHELKLYLARFGYLNYEPAHYQPNANSPSQTFDDELESALKRYQSFYHLNATGTLDGPTISRMVMPRCGHPDIKDHQQMHSKSLHTVPQFQFPQDSPYKWPINKTNLTYAFGFNYLDAYVPPVVRAFDTWSAASGYFTFYRIDNITSADIKISFERGDHGDGATFDGPYGVLAHAFYPTDGRMHYDADETWSVGPGPVDNAIDLQSVSLHEIGHLLGLDHSEDENAIMWSSIPSGSLKGLNSDDILGVKALYGLK